MESCTYLFLTNSIGGISGGSIYVRNKAVWLQEQGWDVVAFDSTGIVNLPVVIDELKLFANNRILELSFHPLWFSKSKRKEILKRIIAKLPSKENVVIESNKLILAEWGELIAQEIEGKHLVFLIGEHEIIEDKESFDFASFKSERMELFSINPVAYQKLFPSCDKQEAELHWWNAKVDAPVIDIANDILDSLPQSDYTFGHFGRCKPYIKNVIEGVNSFAQKHPSYTFYLIFLGVEKLPEKEMYGLTADNVYECFVPSQYPLPLSFFRRCNVIFGTAGCARIAYEQGTKVISMNVMTEQPLGLMGYTTKDLSYDSGLQTEYKTVEEWLDDIIIEKKYDGTNPSSYSFSQRAYDFQLEFATEPDGLYFDVLQKNMGKPITVKDKIVQKMVRIGLCYFVMKRRRIKTLQLQNIAK